MARKEGDGDRCWRAWWKDETSFLQTLTPSTKIWLSSFQARYVIVAASLVYFVGATREQVVSSGIILAVFLFVVVFVRARISLSHQFAVRSMKAILAVMLLIVLLYIAEFEAITNYQYFQYFISFVALSYVTHATCNVLLIAGVRFYGLQQWFKLIDWLIAGLIFCILGLLSVTVIPGIIQTRLMFHNAFSRGVLIDKLLKTKPDDAPAVSAAPTPATRRGRRRDARGPSKSDSPEDVDPEGSPESHLSSSAGGGFDFESISFIERRTASVGGKPGKKLHPSRRDEDNGSGREASPEDADRSSHSLGTSGSGTGLSGMRKMKKGGQNVSFAPASSGLGPRKVPSMSNLEDLAEVGEQDYAPSPQPPVPAGSAVGFPNYRSDSPQGFSLDAGARVTGVPGNMPRSARISGAAGGVPSPRSALPGIPTGALAANQPYAQTKSAGSTPTGVATGPLPTYASPVMSGGTITGRPLQITRSASDHHALTGSQHGNSGGVGSFSLGHAANSHTISPSAFGVSGVRSSSPSISSPSNSNSPAPSSPHLSAQAQRSRHVDKLVGGLPNQALQDERPIPKTVLTPLSSASSFPVRGNTRVLVKRFQTRSTGTDSSALTLFFHI